MVEVLIARICFSIIGILWHIGIDTHCESLSSSQDATGTWTNLDLYIVHVDSLVRSLQAHEDGRC